MVVQSPRSIAFLDVFRTRRKARATWSERKASTFLEQRAACWVVGFGVEWGVWGVGGSFFDMGLIPWMKEVCAGELSRKLRNGFVRNSEGH